MNEIEFLIAVIDELTNWITQFPPDWPEIRKQIEKIRAGGEVANTAGF